MLSEKLTGFVIQSTALSQSRHILTLFTKQCGKRQGVLRLNKKQSRAWLTPLTQLSFQLSGKEHQQLKNLNEVTLESHCFDLAASYSGLIFVQHLAFIIARTQPEDQPDERVYRLLEHGIAQVGSRPAALEILARCVYIEVWLLHFCGVLPRQRPVSSQTGTQSQNPEERGWQQLDAHLLRQVFGRNISHFLSDALQWDSLAGTHGVLGTMWEGFLSRELPTRKLLFKQLNEGRRT